MSLGSATPIAHINLALLGSPVSAPGRYPQSANASALSGGSLSINPALTIDTGHHTPNFDGVPTRFNVTYKHPSPQISLSASFEAADAMLAAASYRQQSLSHFYPPGKSPQAQSPQAKKTFPSVGNTSEGVSSSLSKQSSPVSPHHSPLSSQHSSLIANQSPDLTESKSQASSSAHLVLEQQESERRQRDQKVSAGQQLIYFSFQQSLISTLPSSPFPLYRLPFSPCHCSSPHFRAQVLKSIASRLYGRHRHLERAFAKRDILKQGDLSPGHIRDGTC